MGTTHQSLFWTLFIWTNGLQRQKLTVQNNMVNSSNVAFRASKSPKGYSICSTYIYPTSDNYQNLQENTQYKERCCSNFLGRAIFTYIAILLNLLSKVKWGSSPPLYLFLILQVTLPKDPIPNLTT